MMSNQSKIKNSLPQLLFGKRGSDLFATSEIKNMMHEAGSWSRPSAPLYSFSDFQQNELPVN